jgi:prepilin peptidase dependent protein B
MLKQRGVTLVELMIALAIAVVIIAAVMAVFITTVRHSRESLEQGRLNTELHRTIRIIARDIGRAGYWASATSSQTNPFTQSSTDLTVNGAGNCILLSYDNNGDGSLPAVNSGTDDERYGFRLISGAIQYRPVSATFSCTASAASWTNMTDPSLVTITAFSVTINTSSEPPMEIRNVTISITGQLVSNTSITKTISQTVKVQNDKYAP